MTSLLPKPVEGHIVPGTSSPFIQVYTPTGWETRRLRAGTISTTPYGPQIEKEPEPQPIPTQKPKQIGDEHHHNIMSAISSLVQQNTSQMAEALPADRLWR